MKFSAPHWLTVLAAAVAVCAMALISEFPDYAGYLKGIAAICTMLAAPTIAKSAAGSTAAGIFLLFTLSGCLTPASVPAITALGACIIDRADADANATPAMTDVAIAEDVASYCATDALTVATTLGARKQARARRLGDAGK